MAIEPQRDQWELAEGGIQPLGAIWDQAAQSYQFVLYSRSAGAVTLLLYGEEDFVNPLLKAPFIFPHNKTGRYWHMRVSGEKAGNAKYYAYQVEGRQPPVPTDRFDSEKILLDPYARGVFFPPAHDRLAASQPGSNAGKAPLGVLPPQEAAVLATTRPAAPRHSHDLVIYEMHVRGFTKDASSEVAADRRGTFEGVIDKIPYLQSLGVTAVELMPVHQFDPKEGNYWGYMTLSFFSPHSGYAVGGDPRRAVAEFRAMVDALHAAGIEVFLDSVYNHTTEGDKYGPIYCYKGIDNSSYYVLDLVTNEYVDHSACGNDLRTAHPLVRRLVMDSLRFWAAEMGVDGFRFDLASILARTETGELDQEDPPLISAMSSDPNLRRLRLIAEPWQGAFGGGYMIGREFPGKTWRQWNDHFRSGLRAFVKGDPGCVASLMTRLYGSTDLFPDDLADSFRPAQSVNYIDSHDGLCLYDLVSYTSNDQASWNCGFEGDNGVPPEVAELRRRQVKNFCTLLLLANGTPMFVAGDEFMRTQDGNPNPWNQDNKKSWLDWTLLEKNADIFRFFQLMIQFRKEHPALARSTGWRRHVRWYGATAAAVDISAESRSLAFFLEGSDMGDRDFYVLINSHWEPSAFEIQEPGPWARVVDTALDSGKDIVCTTDAVLYHTRPYTVSPRTVVVLVR